MSHYIYCHHSYQKVYLDGKLLIDFDLLSHKSFLYQENNYNFLFQYNLKNNHCLDCNIYQIYLISDSTGETLERIFLAIKAQFKNFDYKTHFYSFTRTENQISKILENQTVFVLATQNMKKTQALKQLLDPWVRDQVIRLVWQLLRRFFKKNLAII